MKIRRVNRSWPLLVVIGLAAVLAAEVLPAGEPAPEPAPLAAEPASPMPAATARNRYVGVMQCKNCHQKESAGDQFGVWQKTPHAQAFEVLASEKSKEAAAALGIDDPQASEQCLRCHATAGDAEKQQINRGFKHELGVQCETCHGPGELHVKARLDAQQVVPEDGAGGGTSPELPEGEIVRQPPMDTCWQCHNDEHPFPAPFCHCERLAIVRHLDPRKARTAEQQAALEACVCREDCERCAGKH